MNVEMKLAGGNKAPGGTTTFGEVMVGPGEQPTESTVRWIVPDDRLTTELGIRITKFRGRVILDKGPLKKPIRAIMIDRLPYLTWQDFHPLREALARSHKAGRPSWFEKKGNRKD